MRVNPWFAPVLFIIVLVGTLVAAQLTGNFSVSGRTTIDTTKPLAITDIKGWMTLQQVIDGVPISKEELYALIDIPADIATSTALKDLESLVSGFETSAVRDALTNRANAVAAPKDATVATQTAQPSPTALAMTPTIASSPAMNAHPSATPLPAGQVLPANQIKGKMTLREVSDQCVVSLDKLRQALNLPADIDENTQIKALVEAGKLTEVGQVQSAVQALQGK